MDDQNRVGDNPTRLERSIEISLPAEAIGFGESFGFLVGHKRHRMADQSKILALAMSLRNSWLLENRPSCLVSCSMASMGFIELRVRRIMVTA